MSRQADSHPTESLLRRSAAAGLLSLTRGISRIQPIGGRGLRILGYHGVCDDRDADKPWMPDYFVSASAFARQIAHAAQNGRIVLLGEVVDALRDDPLSLDQCIAITFDDVAACTFEHALPVLERHGGRASFFVSTGHVATGRLFDADIIRLLRWKAQLAGPCLSAELQAILENPSRYKRMTVAQLRRLLDGPARRVAESVDSRISNALGPLNWAQVRRIAAMGHEIGAHTVDHAILGAQPGYVRRMQISESVHDLRMALGTSPTGFAYPNGGPGDFGASDESALRYAGVGYALSTRAGTCTRSDGLYDLPRTCIGMRHTATTFALELTGLLDRRRRRQQGWA